MGLFIVYIIKSALCSALFYLFYKVLMSRDTLHRTNRLLLLAIVLLSCVVPFLKYEFPATGGNVDIEMGTATVDSVSLPDAPTTANDTWLWFFVIIIYFAGILFFIGRNIYSVSKIRRLIRNGTATPCEEEAVVLILHDKNVVPFSWMRYVVMSHADWKENGKVILSHETAHIRLRHSWDMIPMELFVSLQWFNPAAWLLRNELQNIHEYQADKSVLDYGVNAKQYQLLIIKKAVGARLYTVANSLNHSNIKKRITMMLKKKSNPWTQFKLLYVLPAAATAVAAFASPSVVASADALSNKVNEVSDILEIESVKNEETIPTKVVSASAHVYTGEDDDPIFQVAEEMPMFPGGEKAFFKFIKDNIKYPAEAEKAVTEGRTYVQFVIRKNGDISDIEIVRSSGNKLLDDEAMRAISIMPKWIPGKQRGEAVNVKYTMPIVFKLATPQKDDDPIFQVAEEMPQFPGNEETLFKFIKDNIKYPAEAVKTTVEGRTYVQFVIRKSGDISDIEIVRSSGNKLLDDEAVRVISIMPKWIPGKQRGEAVNVKYTMPIAFKLK